jgi:uncharacterized protein YfkK (UPF0435 family)
MTKPTKKEEANFLYIGNTIIEVGKKYSLSNRFDSAAPSGMKEIKATKFPFDMNDNKECVFFDDTTGLYDTGLYEFSRVLTTDRKLSPEQRKERVSSYRTKIVAPYEKMKNKDLSPDSAFWGEYRFDAYVNREFDTNNIADLLDLFNVIMQGIACNEDEKDQLFKANAFFNITSIQEVKNKKKESTKDKRTCVDTFNEMADSNREKLDVILGFLNKNTQENIESEDLKDIYYDVINDPKTGADFVKRFTEACSKYETDKGKLEMEYFSIAQKLLIKNKIKKVGSKYMTLNETAFLGTSLQDIAKFCLDPKSPQHEIITELYEQLD